MVDKKIHQGFCSHAHFERQTALHTHTDTHTHSGIRSRTYFDIRTFWLDAHELTCAQHQVLFCHLCWIKIIRHFSLLRFFLLLSDLCQKWRLTSIKDSPYFLPSFFLIPFILHSLLSIFYRNSFIFLCFLIGFSFFFSFLDSLFLFLFHSFLLFFCLASFFFLLTVFYL